MFDCSGFVGISWAVVGENGIETSGCYGKCGVVHTNDINTSTLFLCASISKLFVATAILQLFEAKKLDIDEDINNYISLKVINPHSGVITARMLLEHHSGLSDSEIGLKRWRYESFSSISLEDHLRRHIVPGGEYYNDSLWRESGKYFYSNAGFTLLGYIIEQVSKKSFCEYIRENILIPLDMNNATWDVPEDDNAAIPCDTLKELGHYCVAEYPACQLRVSVDELSHFLQFFICGEYKGKRILQLDTLQLMCPSNYIHGLGWWGKDSMYGNKFEDVWCHGGFMDGVRSRINYYPKFKKGFILLSNSNTDEYPIEKYLTSLILNN